MLNLRSLICAAALSVALPISANAATLLQEIHDYGVGQYDDIGAGNLGPDRVKITDGDAFSDTFDFSSLLGTDITSFEIVLDTGSFSGAFENWEMIVETDAGFVDFPASQTFGLTDNVGFDRPAGDTLSTLTIDATTNSSLFALLTGSPIGTVSISFQQTLFGIPAFGTLEKFTLREASLVVSGAAPVPLPASGLLLLGGIAGFGAMRRRKKA